MTGPYGGPHVLLKRALREGVDGARLGTFLALLAKTSMSAPGAFASRLGDRWRAPRAPALEPVFILGHYRSGTSLVHKLLAADPRLGTVDTFDLLFPFAPVALKRVLRPNVQAVVDRLGVRQGFFHEYTLRLDDPNEIEPWLLATGSEWSSYWGFLFPRRALYHLERFVRFPDADTRARWQRAYEHAVRRATLRSGGRRLVVKDPPNTGRINALLELWPDAGFVHVRRDPRGVLVSMRELWRTTILPRFALQRITEEEVAGVVLGHYETLMQGWHAEHASIPRGRCVELRYEELVRAPRSQIERIYADLPLHPFGGARPAVEARLALERDYRPGRYEDDPPLPRGWEASIARWRARLGYPQSPSAGI